MFPTTVTQTPDLYATWPTVPVVLEMAERLQIDPCSLLNAVIELISITVPADFIGRAA